MTAKWLAQFGPPLAQLMNDHLLARLTPQDREYVDAHTLLVSIQIELLEPSDVRPYFPGCINQARIIDVQYYHGPRDAPTQTPPASLGGNDPYPKRRTPRAPSSGAATVAHISESLLHTLTSSGWFDGDTATASLRKLFPVYTVGSDPLYRDTKREEYLIEMVKTLPIIRLRNDRPHYYVTSCLQRVISEYATDKVSAAKSLASLQERAQLDASSVLLLESVALVATLGLFKDQPSWRSVSTYPDGAQTVGTGKLDFSEDAGEKGSRSLGVMLAQWVADNAVHRQNIGSCLLGDVAVAMPPKVHNWLQSSQKHLYDAILSHAVLNNATTGSQLHAESKKLQISLPGIRLKLRSISPAAEDGSICTAWVAYLRAYKHRKHLKALNRLFPAVSAADSRHQTCHLADWVWSYIHWQPTEQEKRADARSRDLGTASQRVRAINGILQWLPVGTPQPLVIGMLMSALTHEESESVTRVYVTSGLLFTDRNLQMRRAKATSIIVRKCGWLPEIGDLTPNQVRALAYYELLFGRLPHVTDWETEILNRCVSTLHIQRPNLSLAQGSGRHICVAGLRLNPVQLEWQTDGRNTDPRVMSRDDAFYSDLRDELLKICSPLVTAKNTKEPLDRFFARRHEWIASGSSSGAKTALSPRASSALGADKIKVSKRAWAESITLDQVKKVMYDQLPTEVAHASEKYENGKARAIYGVDPMHYVINTYATKGFEEKLHNIPGLEKGATGAEQASLEYRRAHITSDPNIECSMLDYADFNRHHTPEAQALLFEVFAELGAERGASRDWVKANHWVAKSKRRMYALFPNEDKPRRVYQGMFSGTRSTDLINTLLNLAYFRLAANYVANVAKVHPADLYNVHQGDDVWISNRNPIWARMLYYTLNSMGFLFQESKQMFGQGRGEYLRVLYLNGTGGGYFARAVANYITRPLQQDASLDPLSWARTIREGCSLLSRRGMTLSGLRPTYNNDMSFWARARAHPLDYAPISLPPELLNGPGYRGGLGCPPPRTTSGFTAAPGCAHFPPYPTFTSAVSALKYELPTHMTDDWLDFVSKNSVAVLGYAFDREALRATMVDTNYRPDLKALVRDKGWATLKRQWRNYKGSMPRALVSEFSSASLRTVHSFQQALYHAKPCNMVAQKRGLRSSLLVWEQHLAHICDQQADRVFDISRQSSILHALINKSQFKSETTFARAYHLSRIDAVSMILAQAEEHGYGNNDVAQLVSVMRAHKNEDFLAWMLGESGDIEPGMSDWANVANWQYAQSQYLNATLQSIQSHPKADGASLLWVTRLVWDAWLDGIWRYPQVLTAVVY